jgi:hypothetical protein
MEDFVASFAAAKPVAQPLPFYGIFKIPLSYDMALKKKRPHFWGRISRGQIWKVSGKAMQVTAPRQAGRHFGKC